MALKVESTADSQNGKNLRVFIYGEPRSGKTHFAATWPRPLFFVPELSRGETDTANAFDFPVVYFDDMEDCLTKAREIFDMVQHGKAIGPYKPMTLVVDNLTTTMIQWEEQCRRAGMVASTGNLSNIAWGKLLASVTGLVTNFHRLPLHVIWTAHAKVITTTARGPDGKMETTSTGGFALQGDAKNLVPGQCGLLLRAECIHRGVRDPLYIVWGKRDGIWPAGIRSGKSFTEPGSPTLFTKLEDPSYDKLAPLFGLPLLAEAEAA